MEETGGEPDIVSYHLIQNHQKSSFMIVLWKHQKGVEAFVMIVLLWMHVKNINPKNNVLEIAETIGIELLTEEQYKQLQSVEHFDLKTSSWVKTPGDVRKLGGAIFCDSRYGRVFTYHNGAQSYYATRGFRGRLKT